MSFEGPDLATLRGLFADAEDNVRHFEPRFRGGFAAIRLQGDITKITVTKLSHLRARIVDKSNSLAAKLQEVRQQQTLLAQNEAEIRNALETGTSLVNLAGFNHPDPVLSQIVKRVNKSKLSPAQRVAPTHQAKVHFQNADYTLRNKMTGLTYILEMIDDCDSRLGLRLRGIRTLIRIGEKWQRGELAYEDGIKVGMAEQEVNDCEEERIEIAAMIDLLDHWLDEQDAKDAEKQDETEDEEEIE